MQENLNLDYHIKRLIIIALAKYKTETEQSRALGVSKRTLYNYRKRYSL